jgi:hypothetical protein
VIRSGLVVVVLALVALLVAGAPTRAAADDAPSAELAVEIVCASAGRSQACPATLRELVDATPLVRAAEPGAADVTVSFTATEDAAVDRVVLRFTASIKGAPGALDVAAAVDPAGDAAAQLAQLQPAFLRGIAIYVAARVPGAVTTELIAPADGAAPAAKLSPWSEVLQLGGGGNFTGSYKSASGFGSLDLIRKERDSSWWFNVRGMYGYEDRPPLIIDGQEVSVDSDQYELAGWLQYTRNLTSHWAVGAILWWQHQDPAGQFRYYIKPALGIEWDRYSADDPKGNRLAVAYNLGAELSSYNVVNVDGEKVARYPWHLLGAVASVRKDKVSFSFGVNVNAQMLRPTHRYSLSASPGMQVQLGRHVDLEIFATVTRREFPDPVIDETDFNQVVRASYADPLSASLSFSLSLHWDATNGARNDRFDGGLL